MKNIELRKQRAVEDIICYSKILEKCYEQMSFVKKGEVNKLHSDLKRGINRISLKSKFKKKDKDKIIRQVKHYAKEVSKYFIVLKLKKPKQIIKKENGEAPLEEVSDQLPASTVPQYEIVKKSGIKIDYKDTLDPAIFPWNKIFIEGLTTKEIFNFYKRIIPSESIFSKVILNKSIRKGQEILINIINDKDKTQRIERAAPDNNLYCYCRKQYSEEYMVGCNEGDEKCAVGGWVHQACDKRLQALSQKEIEDLEFTCLECLKSKEEQKRDEPKVTLEGLPVLEKEMMDFEVIGVENEVIEFKSVEFNIERQVLSKDVEIEVDENES